MSFSPDTPSVTGQWCEQAARSMRGVEMTLRVIAKGLDADAEKMTALDGGRLQATATRLRRLADELAEAHKPF